ncbi:kinase-like protein [Aaosphaeria arxii CBS 175.79]|uniref:non-specific serine/threonine protein kinase n=1 Tax=Aaosphaeria arxii CBS 175.79 TaxID=1450172 RepID=A0A6A5XU09_9PLEO|nr:kinase-like protein [Aaosphaeria arxii CBS 175.79]KAF2016399.1 kinase-like protein [Aaosphaeria arxii CBS 175.79]
MPLPHKRPTRFKVVQRFGTAGGGMNKGIYIVKDETTEKKAVEKTFTKHDINTGNAKRELQYLRQLSGHPNITRFVDGYYDPRRGGAGVFMNYCELGPLDQLIIRQCKAGMRPIGEHYLWTWFIQLAGALSYCYNGPSGDPRARAEWNFIIHRDVKPANVLLTRPTEGPHRGMVIVNLADFGCAVSKREYQNGRANPARQSKYTDLYRPPESPYYNQTSDVWQVGVTMISLCHLKLQWHQAYNWRFHPAPGYSPQLNEMILRCMDDNYRTRITASVLKHALERSYGKIRNFLPPSPDLILPTGRR